MRRELDYDPFHLVVFKVADYPLLKIPALIPGCQ